MSPEGAPQFSERLSIRSEFAELLRVQDWLDAFCRVHLAKQLTRTQIEQLELGVHEALANIVRHAYHRQTDRSIILDVAVYEGQLVCTLSHQGDPFEPSEVRLPDPASLATGGYGLYLIQQSADRVEYRNGIRGWNSIVLTKFFRATTEPS